MSLSTLQKTYRYATIANALTATDRGNQLDMVLQLHTQRQAWGFEIAGSGNGVSGAMDGVDRWSGSSSFPTSTLGVWCVYENPATGAQDLLHVTNFGQNDYSFYHSPGGLFTGGSSSARPTATDETSLYANSFFGRGSGGTNPQFVCNALCSDDLEVFRMSFWWNDQAMGDIWYDKVDDPTPGWTTPNYGLVDKQGTAIASSGVVGDITNWCITPVDGNSVVKGWGLGARMHLLCTFEGCGASYYPHLWLGANVAKNKFSLTWRNLPRPGLYVPIAGVNGGWHGRLFDTWWVSRGTILGATRFTSSSTAPLDGSKQRVIIGDRMLPWNGTAFRTT